MPTNTPKPPKITAYDLKYNYDLNKNGNFFDRASMKFFGDTMSNYYVPAATQYINTYSGDRTQCYELQRKHPVKSGLSASAWFDCKTFQRVLSKDKG